VFGDFGSLSAGADAPQEPGHFFPLHAGSGAPQAPVRTQMRVYRLEEADSALDDQRHGRVRGAAVLSVAGHHEAPPERGEGEEETEWQM
jgi:hypothetical protein